MPVVFHVSSRASSCTPTGGRGLPRPGEPLTDDDDLRPVRVCAASLDSVASEWDELAAGTGASPFVRPGWIEAWWDAFGRGRLTVLAARRDRALVGVLPVSHRHGVLRSPSNEHTPVFDVVAVDEAAVLALGSLLFDARARAVTLVRLAGDGPGLVGLEACGAQAGYRTAVSPVARSPYIACPPTLADHERGLSGKLRQDLARCLRRLGEEGAVTIEVTNGRSDLAGLLDEGYRVEALSWKGARGTAIASDARTRRFYDAVARWASARGWLRLVYLRLDGRAIAFQFDLEAGGIQYMLKTGYDPAFRRYSPGKLLMDAMAARAVSTGLETYELLGTVEPWKERWTATSREYVRLDAYAPSAAGSASWALRTHGRRLARRIPLASRAAAVLRR
jgi:CelD/BcsL family acetyltransferase involved in cellulose biosynthesis